VAALTLFAASGCGGGSDKATSSAASSTSTQSSDAKASGAAFCAALVTLANASTAGDNPDDVLKEVEANTPAELKDDIADFVADARAVTAAFSAAGGPTASIDTASVLAGLTPEQQQFAKDLAAAAGGETVSDTSAGHVIKYFVDHCGSAEPRSSSFSSVGSAVN